MFLKQTQRQLLRTAYIKALESPDPSTQNAALLVGNTGATVAIDINRFPRGVQYNKERWQKPLKYKFIEHAERTVIYNYPFSTQGLIMVCPWAACTDCARAIIESGISALITHQQAHNRSPEFWEKEIEIAKEMLAEAGVPIIFYNGKIGGVTGILHSGQKWNP